MDRARIDSEKNAVLAIALAVLCLLVLGVLGGPSIKARRLMSIWFVGICGGDIQGGAGRGLRAIVGKNSLAFLLPKLLVPAFQLAFQYRGRNVLLAGYFCF